MEPDNKPKCSHDQSSKTEIRTEYTNKGEITKASSDDAPCDIASLVPPNSFQLGSDSTLLQLPNNINNLSPCSIKTHQSRNISQSTSDLISQRSIVSSQPQSLFIQALSQLKECSFNSSIIDHLKKCSAQPQNNTSKIMNTSLKSGEISPPDSLTSAPPSYSFVLRQMTAHRRPRLMGTFIPSPSFVQHTPPPNYATAFDIYVDNPIPPPPSRAYNFSFASILVVCPDCGYAGMTTITTKITMCTHLCAFLLFILFCWICVPLPYVLRSCKNVYHYCGNCRNFLGMYCPTSPDNSYR